MFTMLIPTPLMYGSGCNIKSAKPPCERLIWNRIKKSFTRSSRWDVEDVTILMKAIFSVKKCRLKNLKLFLKYLDLLSFFPPDEKSWIIFATVRGSKEFWKKSYRGIVKSNKMMTLRYLYAADGFTVKSRMLLQFHLKEFIIQHFTFFRTLYFIHDFF